MDFCLADYRPETGSKLIKIKQCDGETPERTLQQQLLDHHIIDRRWSLDDDIPGTIFHWFRHNAPYQATSISFREDGHCGICFHDISNKYIFKKTDCRYLRLYDSVYLDLPETIISGSECIHLKDDMQNLVHYIHSHYLKNGSIDFVFGRLDARAIIESYDQWDKDEIAMPVAWFYFDPIIRIKLKLGQVSSRYGFHVCMPITYNSIPKSMSRALREQRSVRAYDLFRGWAEDGKWADENTERQVATPYYYVIISRSSAQKLTREI